MASITYLYLGSVDALRLVLGLVYALFDFLAFFENIFAIRKLLLN
jgi:hypothetical protein